MPSSNDVLPLEDVKKEILEFCLEPHGRVAILEYIHVELNPNNYSKYVTPLVKQRFIASALLGNRSSAKQKYVITQKGLNYLKAIA